MSNWTELEIKEDKFIIPVIPDNFMPTIEVEEEYIETAYTTPQFDDVDVSLEIDNTSCELNIINNKIETTQELARSLCNLLFQFDNCPEFYTKDDYLDLINTISKSLIYTYDKIDKLKAVSVPNFIKIAELDTNPINEKLNDELGWYIGVTSGVYSYFNDIHGQPISILESDIKNGFVILYPRGNLLKDGFQYFYYEKHFINLNLDKFANTDLSNISNDDFLNKGIDSGLLSEGRFKTIDGESIAGEGDIKTNKVYDKLDQLLIPDLYCYAGMTASIISDVADNNGLYLLTQLPNTELSNWQKINGGGGSITWENLN